jgi:peptidoglycan/xylan/chitin deacetylase (PgdA/CDA1 family)
VKLITTSWDDGHEADFRIAKLLDKYQLKGTFYIPKANAEHAVMSPSQIRVLSKQFEIGGHTLNHTRLRHVDESILDKEIGGSFHWLTDVIGTAPTSFCFPGGDYNNKAVKSAYKHGYKFLRTTELLSVYPPHGLALFPTTIQLYEHSRVTYTRHLMKRLKWKSLFRWMMMNSTSDLLKLTQSYLDRIETKGGCFHLWGHSWEIEENGLWKKLEEVFKILSNRPGFTYVENRHLLQG